MLSRARSYEEKAGAVDWCEGSAAAMPFAASSFDAVLCQHGLQFMPDKAAVLSEMHRVLAPDGRLFISVWRSIEHCPWQAAIADAIERSIGSEPAAQVRSAFTFGDADQLRDTIATAGFSDVEIRVESETIRHSSLADYVPGYISATPVAAAVAGLDTGTQNKIVADVREALAAHLVGEGLAVPIEAHMAIAHRP
jgi:SAM-dependent methyltransferase